MLVLCIIVATIPTVIGATPAKINVNKLVLGTNNIPTQEYFVISNTGGTAAYLTGWTIKDKQNHIFKFNSVKLNPKQVITIKSGNTLQSTKYGTWYQKSKTGRLSKYSYCVWNNKPIGDTAYLYNNKNKLVSARLGV